MIIGTRQGWRGKNKALQLVGAMEGSGIKGIEGINPATNQPRRKASASS